MNFLKLDGKNELAGVVCLKNNHAVLGPLEYS